VRGAERADTAYRVVQSVHVGLNSLTLLQWGTGGAAQRWLVPAKGEKLATFALTEPGVGTDAGNLASTARRDGDAYVLNGHKIWISLADLADHFLVFASVDRGRKHRGITAFVLERGMAGLTTGTLHGKLGIRAGNTGLIDMEGVRVPVNRIGEEGEGFHSRDERHRRGQVHGCGGRRGARAGVPRRVDPRKRYAHERETFGGEEIGHHQARQADEVANMAKGTEIGRLLGVPGGRVEEPGCATPETSLAKWHTVDHSVQTRSTPPSSSTAPTATATVPGRAVPAQQQGRGDLRGHAPGHTLIEADYALGYREDRPLRCEAWPAQGFRRPSAG
jgi:glutaryl-CoA dehydrogenase (non-decarboxylating)